MVFHAALVMEEGHSGRPLGLRRMVLAIITLASPFMGLEEFPSFVWKRKSQLSTILLRTSRAGGLSTEMGCSVTVTLRCRELRPERYEPHNSSSSSFLCLDQQKFSPHVSLQHMILGQCRLNDPWPEPGMGPGVMYGDICLFDHI